MRTFSTNRQFWVINIIAAVVALVPFLLYWNLFNSQISPDLPPTFAEAFRRALTQVGFWLALGGTVGLAVFSIVGVVNWRSAAPAMMRETADLPRE
jgi:hypothetical protein